MFWKVKKGEAKGRIWKRMLAQREELNAASDFRSIEDLQSGGINVSDIKKLQDHGLNTVGQVLQSSVRDLLSIKGTIIHFLEESLISYY